MNKKEISEKLVSSIEEICGYFYDQIKNEWESHDTASFVNHNVMKFWCDCIFIFSKEIEGIEVLENFDGEVKGVIERTSDELEALVDEIVIPELRDYFEKNIENEFLKILVKNDLIEITDYSPVYSDK